LLQEDVVNTDVASDDGEDFVVDDGDADALDDEGTMDAEVWRRSACMTTEAGFGNRSASRDACVCGRSVRWERH
jgi:hypothetical protein